MTDATFLEQGLPICQAAASGRAVQIWSDEMVQL